jgi:hypothetical protein
MLESRAPLIAISQWIAAVVKKYNHEDPDVYPDSSSVPDYAVFVDPAPTLGDFRRFSAALAEAEARGRRQGLDEAAEVCELRVSVWRHHIGKPSQTAMDEQVASLFENAAQAIRSLATAPAETQKPGTGESANLTDGAS